MIRNSGDLYETFWKSSRISEFLICAKGVRDRAERRVHASGERIHFNVEVDWMRFQIWTNQCIVWTDLYDNHDIYFYLLKDIELARNRDLKNLLCKGKASFFV